MNQVTDTRWLSRDDLPMDVLVTITIANDDGEELDTVSASADTPEEAFQLALQQLEFDEDK